MGSPLLFLCSKPGSSTGVGVAELSAALGFAELLRNHQFCDVWTICEQAPIVQTSQYCSFVVCKSLCLALLKPAAVVRSLMLYLGEVVIG